ncbi:hypothetical protein [Kordia sp.]|uniref:hypothetical protein n=1 Tax=Kordia sp. TaxID=1965332 RepID=UPI003D6AB8E6
MGRKKKNIWTKKNIINLILFFGIIVVLLKINIYDKNKLANDSFKTVGVIEKLHPKKSIGKRSKDAIYFYFIKNDIVYHKILTKTVGVINNHKIKLNDCFELKVANSSNSIYELNLTKRIDTFIDKKLYQKHDYNSFIHRNIIE